MDITKFEIKKRSGEMLDTDTLKNKVLLIVNTATGCGFTPQYEGIEELYKNYHDKGLEILDFPCNQFGHQAPGDDNEIHEFCTAKYQTTFDQMSKIDVNGENAHPLFEALKEEAPKDIIKGLKNKMAMKAIYKFNKSKTKDDDINWNFTKFLVDRNGKVVGRYSPTFNPKDLSDVIDKLV